VGAKAAGLHRLRQHYNVPDGFCLSTEIFARWAGADGAPGALAALVGEAYRRLSDGDDPARVAVRSSAVDEDGAASSFAGQYDTFLNVEGRDALVRAVLACWESARSARVENYLAWASETGPACLAVLVQKLVAADVSAVVFSANPGSGARNEILINSNWGLGESVVAGEATPDSFVVDKRDFSIIRRTIAEKSHMSIARGDGTASVAVPRSMRRRACLDDTRIRELARLAVDLENRLGFPVDIETAYGGSSLYLLQCRPITTIIPTDAPGEQ